MKCVLIVSYLLGHAILRHNTYDLMLISYVARIQSSVRTDSILCTLNLLKSKWVNDSTAQTYYNT